MSMQMSNYMSKHTCSRSGLLQAGLPIVATDRIVLSSVIVDFDSPKSATYKYTFA